MAERRKNRKRKDEVGSSDAKIAEDKPSKEEYDVAKWIRSNVPSKKTKFDRTHNVEYFTGTRAVDALLENSPWSTVFETREQVSEYLDMMLRHKFFHRAKKVVITEEELNKMRGSKKKVTKEDKKEDSKDAKDEKVEEKTDEQKEQKKKPKVRLEMHMEQYFVDCNDAYVWIYEPVPVYYWFFGTLVVLAAIVVCLFPLWPLTIRHGVYYLSVAAAGFLVFILALTIFRMIVFCIVWIFTLGKCHFWLLPNLTADVGFFASFWPLYQYECGSTSNNDKKSSKKKRKKEKDSDSEDAPLLQPDAEKCMWLLSSGSEGDTHTNGIAEEKSSTKEEPKEEVSRVEESLPSEEKKTSSDSAEGEDASEEGSESEKSNTGRDFVMV